ncbi:MAG: flagellum-specific ATP synthase FliI, partial [Desulfovibrio sp.]|nr:flagellum-specific ATP synthase FliI [Desulfovibrio sp.]
MSPDPQGVLNLLSGLRPVTAYGKVNKIVGLVAEGSGIRAPLGSLCHILPDAREETRPGEGVPVEVVGFRDGNLLFMPYGDLRGVRPGSLVRNSSLPPLFPAGQELLGRTLDAFGHPLDKGPALQSSEAVPLYAGPPLPLDRPRIDSPLDVGVR